MHPLLKRNANTIQFPLDYYHNPHVDKPLDDIFTDFDTYTFEVLPDSTPDRLEAIHFVVVMPPLYYDGKFIKGIAHCHAVDVVMNDQPIFGELFNTIGDSFCASVSWSEQADALFTIYDNPLRKDWFRRTFPHRNHQLLFGAHTGDHLNENHFRPRMVMEKDIDVLCIARPDLVKNIPMIVKGLRAYRQKYPQHPLKMTWVCGEKLDVNRESMGFYAKSIYQEIEEILVHPQDYIHFINGHVDYMDLPQLYSRARVTLLGSLMEGKNRTVLESAACNTPAITFKAYNQYIRGECPAMPPNSGLEADFNEESLADTLYTVLQNPDQFQPRQGFLSEFGRTRFLNRAIDLFPYYPEHLPDYEAGNHHHNLWLDLAMTDNYQKDLVSFLQQPGVWNFPFTAQGIHQVREALGYYAHQYKRWL